MDKKTLESIKLVSRLNFFMHEKLGPAYRRVDDRDKLLNKNQIRTLMIIGNRGKLTSSTLGCLLYMKKGSVTTLIDGLVNKGMAKRENDSEDRRKTWISLTDEGQLYRKENYRLLQIEIHKILEELPEDDQQDLFDGVEKVISVLKKL